MADLGELTEAIKAGNRDDATALTGAALEAEADPHAVLAALVSGMDDVGRRFKAEEIFMTEVLVAARAMKESMALLEPSLAASGYEPLATAVVGTVEGDLHDIGKSLVTMMWQGAGFNVHDLGVNVTADAFVEAVTKLRPKIVGLSALLTTTMPAMKTTVEKLRAANVDGLKIIVGGGAITREYADQIGADGFAPDAASAVDTAREMIAA